MPSTTTPRPGRGRFRDAPPAIRLLVGVVLGVAVAVGIWTVTHPPVAVVLGWAGTAATFTAWTWCTVWPMEATETATHATREEPTRAVTHLIVLAAAVASVVIVGLVLVTSSQSGRAVTAGIAVLGVVVSWATVHTIFGLTYARLYYTGVDGGIDFHQPEPPRYTDFLYIGFTVGMSFAISDTDLESSEMRRVALGHALLSYLFGSVVLAGLVNLVAGM
ncbi:DUF1345 domain-containing protein [Cellulosimicrobium sp. TH-20]|uniref:DUF1345 domain-containing protein n=1 Tax=unclassified Cellulosimicrobium TaxID=2624466 RepID=UPI001B5AA62D